jgi:TM2 domain-containing membrane protein YozV
MRKLVFFFVLFSFFTLQVEAAGSFNTVQDPFATYIEQNLNTTNFKDVTIKEIETEIGRKLTLREKAAVKILKKDASKQNSAGSKSQLVALLLCIFVGVLGIHRFYLGYIGIGIIQLLTAGGFGVWTLIDLILIITGSLQPKDGEYTETL